MASRQNFFDSHSDNDRFQRPLLFQTTGANPKDAGYDEDAAIEAILEG